MKCEQPAEAYCNLLTIGKILIKVLNFIAFCYTIKAMVVNILTADKLFSLTAELK